MKNLHRIKDSKREDSKPRHRGSLPVLPFHISIHWGSPSRSVKSKGKSNWQKSILKRTSLQGRISQIVGNELNSANEQQGLGVAVLVLVLIISPVIIFLVRSATITIQVRGNTRLFWIPCPRSSPWTWPGRRTSWIWRRGEEINFSFRRFFLPPLKLTISSQMLPPTVAQALQLKKAVTAETFESVTVRHSFVLSALFSTCLVQRMLTLLYIAKNKKQKVTQKGFYCWNKMPGLFLWHCRVQPNPCREHADGGAKPSLKATMLSFQIY